MKPDFRFSSAICPIYCARYKGYALIEYEKRSQADEAIREASGTVLLDQTVQCDYAFVKPTVQQQCVDPMLVVTRNARRTDSILSLDTHRQPKPQPTQRRGRSASPPKAPLVTRID